MALPGQNLNRLDSGSDKYTEPLASAARRWNVLAASFLCYGFDALDFMVLALALPMIIREWHLSLAQAGLIGTAGMIGTAFGGVLVGWYSDNYGRRRALLASVLTFTIFTAAVAVARERWDVMTLRFVAGLGLGGIWGIVASLINETWPPENRGRAVSFALSAWPVGIVAAAFLAGRLLPEHNWRSLFLCGSGAIIAFFYVLLFVPESTTWKREQNQRQSGAITHVSDIFTPELVRNTVLATAAVACAHIGYWGTNTWLPTFLMQDRHLDPAEMASFVTLLNAGMFVGYQVLGLLSDRLNRRKALLICFCGAAVLIPIYTLITNTTVLYWLGPVMAMFFAYSGPFGAYLSELYPTSVRGLGAGFCFNIARGIAALSPYLLGGVATYLGLGSAIMLSAAGYLFAGLILLQLPATAPEFTRH